MTLVSVDMGALKVRLKATWMSGDYAAFSTYLVTGAMEFLDNVKVAPGSKVLDIACGAGQTAIPMARMGCDVTGVDIATNLIEEARDRAQAEDLNMRFDEGDAEDLPYGDASFDVVFSLIGAMFAPQPQLVAAEMARVCRPGGRIIMGNWTPGGFVGDMFRTLGAHVPPPQGIPPAAQWGDETILRERLGKYVSDLKITPRVYPMIYPFGPEGVADYFFRLYGPTNRGYASLSTAGQEALRRDMADLWARHSVAKDGSVEVWSEYLEVQAIRR